MTQRELQESSRRLRQDCDHRVALEGDKARLMEEERARLLQQVEREMSSDSVEHRTSSAPFAVGNFLFVMNTG